MLSERGGTSDRGAGAGGRAVLGRPGGRNQRSSAVCPGEIDRLWARGEGRSHAGETTPRLLGDRR
jgi:hypothetical protein